MFDYISYCKDHARNIMGIYNFDELPLIDSILFYFIYNKFKVYDVLFYDDFIDNCTMEYIKENSCFSYEVKKLPAPDKSGLVLIGEAKPRTNYIIYILRSNELTEKQKMMIKLKFGSIVSL